MVSPRQAPNEVTESVPWPVPNQHRTAGRHGWPNTVQWSAHSPVTGETRAYRNNLAPGNSLLYWSTPNFH